MARAAGRVKDSMDDSDANPWEGKFRKDSLDATLTPGRGRAMTARTA